VQKAIYTVIVDGENLKCIDTSSGANVGSINITGSVVSGPVVIDDRCTVVFDSYMGRKGKVFKLPSFNIVTTFDA